MKKTMKIFWLVCLVLLACTLVLTSCEKEDDWNDKNDSYDDEENGDEHTHTFVDGVCECGATNFSESEGLTYELSEDGNSYVVTGIGSCTDNIVVIPSTYNDLPVTSIGQYAFEQCTNLTKVVICDNVTRIDAEAFEGCSNLTSAILGKGVTFIGESAFRECTSLTSINIPDGVTEIDEYAFCDCTSLTTISIPVSVTWMGERVFLDCSGLTSVTIPDTIPAIYEWTFAWCSSLTTINYTGTTAKWNKTHKGYEWDRETGNYTVYCSDGTITK